MHVHVFYSCFLPHTQHTHTHTRTHAHAHAQDITPKVQRKPSLQKKASMQRLKPTTPANPLLASPETRRRAEEIWINVSKMLHFADSALYHLPADLPTP